MQTESECPLSRGRGKAPNAHLQSSSDRPTTALSLGQTKELRAEVGVKATVPVFMAFTFSKPFNLRSHDSVFIMIRSLVKTFYSREFSGGPMVRTLPSNSGSTGLNPGQRTKTPHVMQCSQKLIKKYYIEKYNEVIKL